VKHGSERVVDDARDHLFRIRTLTDFTHHQDGGDKGAGVREKAKALVELLNDNLRIREEREQARRLRDKYVGISNVGAPTSISLSSASAYRGDDSWDHGRSVKDSSSSRAGTGGGGRSGAGRADWRASESSSRGFGGDIDAAPSASSAPRHPAQRKGRRPAGGGDLHDDEAVAGATIADLPPSQTESADFSPFGDSAGVADFDAFGPAQSLAPSVSAPAPPPAIATGGPTGRLSVNIRPSTGATTAPILRPPPAAVTSAQHTTSKPAQSVEEFGLFEAAVPVVDRAAPSSSTSDWSDFVAPPPASAASEPFDPFSGATTPTVSSKPSAAAVLAAAYDPFASPLSAGPHTVGGGGAYNSGSSRADPFAGTPGMNLAAALAATGAKPPSLVQPGSGAPFAASAADEFGGFTSAGVKDDDVDRLFLSGGMSLGNAPVGGSVTLQAGKSRSLC
jgi:hypothetical protein